MARTLSSSKGKSTLPSSFILWPTA